MHMFSLQRWCISSVSVRRQKVTARQSLSLFQSNLKLSFNQFLERSTDFDFVWVHCNYCKIDSFQMMSKLVGNLRPIKNYTYMLESKSWVFQSMLSIHNVECSSIYVWFFGQATRQEMLMNVTWRIQYSWLTCERGWEKAAEDNQSAVQAFIKDMGHMHERMKDDLCGCGHKVVTRHIAQIFFFCRKRFKTYLTGNQIFLWI